MRERSMWEGGMPATSEGFWGLEEPSEDQVAVESCCPFVCGVGSFIVEDLAALGNRTVKETVVPLPS